jgi:general secretion pathway protein I
MVTRRPWMMTERSAHLVAGAAGGSSPRSRQLATYYRWLRSCRRGVSRARSEAGFTLVEVIVALAMLSIGLTLVLGLISSSLGRTASAQRMAEAGSLAQSLLAEVGTKLAIKPEERDGLYPNGYRWHLKMLPYGDGNESEEAPVGLYTISTEVEWGEGTERRSYALSTLRLGPKGARP